MSEENVVRRNPKDNRRKNTDGYRTDSGCFEDVDLQMANRLSPTSNSSESVVVDNDVVTTDHSSEECQPAMERADASPVSPSLADECADDKDFHAILKRLSDITSDPGDLYRLCFSSRLSFCGHMSGSTENEEPLSCTGEIDQNDTTVLEQANGCTNCEIPNESFLKEGEKYAKRSSHGQQCVELLSVLSSFMVKAKENPSMLNHSSLGNSLVAQLSSLLSTLEEAKGNASQSNEGQPIADGQQVSSDNLEPSKPTQLAAHEFTAQSASIVAEHNTSLFPQDSNTAATAKIDLTLTNSKDHHEQQASHSIQRNIDESDLILKEELSNDSKQPLTLSHSEEFESPLPSSSFEARHQSTHSNTDSEVNGTTLIDFLDTQNKPPSPLSDAEKLETPLTTSSLKTSFATNRRHSEFHGTCTTSFEHPAKHPLNNQNETPSLLDLDEEVQTSFPTISPQTMIDHTDHTLQHALDNHGEHPLLLNRPEDNNVIPKLNIINNRSSTRSETDDGDVVTNGRRAVKPYSWDYGDIWEKELKRAKSSESFNNDAKGGRLPSRKDPATDMMPSFEEIRDELFQNAGFVNDNSDRYDGSKRRSRSADARSNLQDDSVWPEYHSAQSDMHSPFVRTIYQNETTQSTGLRRSWSSNHISGNSVMVNVNWTHGRQMRVITGSADLGFDDVRAQIIKEAVVKTSTFRGPKPWSVLKRRPSGLRRRSARNESFRSNKSNESRAKVDHDSESSDSPYVSATSSDCLTMATDDSSSVTSSQYYAASSLPSSPSVSNRNSACFSDTSTSDTSDIRRVVYQSSSSESAPRERYTWGYDTPSSRGMTLDQRFGYIEKRSRVLPNEGFQNTSRKGPKSPLISADDFCNEDSKNIRGQPHTLPCKWQGDRLVSPLLVRSESDLNCLTKVNFVGDSYSRSRISKNVRYTRNRSQSPSPVGARSPHTRVVSCEIVHSDNRKRDVYTKVNISESLNDEEATKIHDSQNTKLGYPTTRRSWHGQTPTRVSSRHSPTNKTSTNGSPRYSFPSRLGQQQRQTFQSQREAQVEKPVHAKLVAVNNHQDRTRTHWSTSSLRMPASERPRLLSDSVVMNRPHGYPSMNYNVHPTFERNFTGSRSRNVGRAQASNVGLRQEHRRSPPDYFTALKHSQGFQRQGNHAYFPEAERHLANTDRGFSTGRNLPTEKNRFHTNEPMSHIVKETSFVGPSTFTKYQPFSNPSFTRARRSRSFNEKDTIARRRLHDSDIYRRRAMEINQKHHSDGECLNHFSRCDSDTTAVHGPERRRRYSEGATRRPTRRDVSSSDGIVDISYCDPRRESIREGTYSITNAESAHAGAKSDDTRIPSQIKLEGRITNHVNGEKTSLQNGCRINGESSFNDFGQRETDQTTYKSIQVNNSDHNVFEEQNKFAEPTSKKIELDRARKTISLHGKKDLKTSAENNIPGVTGQDMRYSGSRGEQAVNSVTEDRFASNQPSCDSVVLSSSLPPHAKIYEVRRVDKVDDFVNELDQQRKCSESKSKQTEHVKSVRNSRIKSADENNLPGLPYEEIDERHTDVSLRNESSYTNTGESMRVISPTLREEKINKTHTVVPSASRHTDDASAVILAQQLPFSNVDKSKPAISSILPHEGNDKNKVVVSNQAALRHKPVDETAEVILATELQQKRNETNAVISQHLPYAKQDKANTSVSHQETFLYKQRLMSPLSQYKNIDGKNSIISPNGVLSSAQRNSNTVDSGEVANTEEKETNVILSPILPNRMAHDESNEVNVFIDYRNKRPVSVEFSDEDVSFFKILGTSARMSRKCKQNTNGECWVRTGRNTSCTVLDSDASKRTEQNVKNEGEVSHSRLSRKDRHEQEMLTNKVKNENMPVSNYQPSPEPYRHDGTIIYTDARTSFGSDTDSISRDSTVSSSGSDMTVILHEDMDISVDDLKQLTESGSKIGIEIAPIDVETGDGLLDHPDNVPDELPPAMELSNSFTNYQKRVSGNINANPELAVTKEASDLKSENSSRNNTLKRLIDAQNNENLSSDNLVPSSCNMQSSCSSIASSRASGKSTGTENSKGNSSSKNGGKGFLSKLKNFRNSFRGKKSDSVSFGKNGNRSKNSEGKIMECDDLHNGSEDVPRHLPSSTDANANVLSKPRNRTKSETRSVYTQGTQAMSRRSYDAFRHQNNNLRNVVGVKSVSSDHLNAYRINNTPHMNEITAKSLDVLVETCI